MRRRRSSSNSRREQDLIKEGAVSSIWRRRGKKKAKGARDERENEARGTAREAEEKRRNVPPNAEREALAARASELAEREIRVGRGWVERKRERWTRERPWYISRKGDARWRSGSLKLSSAPQIPLLFFLATTK